jgi:antitoxin YefM
MRAVSLREAQATIADLVARVVADQAPIAITRSRGEAVVLISASDWAEIEARLSTPTPLILTH